MQQMHLLLTSWYVPLPKKSPATESRHTRRIFMEFIIGGIAIFAISAGIAHILLTLKIASKAKKVSASELSARKHGLFIEHGMVFEKDGKGVIPQKKLSDYFYDSISN